MQQRAFAERFLKHLDKIGPDEIESFVLRTVRERDFIAQIFDTLLAGVVVMDGKSRVTLINQAARRILKWPKRRRVDNESLLELLQAGDLHDLVGDFVDNPRLVQNHEMVLSAGENRVFDVHLIPIGGSNIDQEMVSAALILQDLTSARERQLRTSQAEKIASLATLTSGVAHEIKNPLNSLSIHVQLLERAMQEQTEGQGMSANSRQRVEKSCQVIREEVERLRLCVDDFIDAARPREPQLRTENLNRLVSRVLDMAGLELEERHIDVETFLDIDLPAALIDETQMLSALRNMMRNAIEAIEAARRETGEGRISLRTSVVDDRIVLSISDNGCGIADSDIPKIFEPYFTTKFNGSGLGLMAINRIVREHGGEIKVSSTEDVGTTFKIELPISKRSVKLLDN